MSSVLAAEIESRLSEVAVVCARLGVRRLELIGSGASGAFDPRRSDLDFLVALAPVRGVTPFEQYFGLKEELERLFGRPVDLVMEGASGNPYFLETIEKHRRLLYGA
jgi:hypothetical protein